MIQLAQWDTEHLGLKIGNLILNKELTQVEMTEALGEAKAEHYDLLYFKENRVEESLLSSHFLLADERVIYKMQISNRGDYVNDPCVVSYLHRPLDVDVLSLALQSGAYSRYYLDKNMPLQAFLVLYRTWIEKSLSGEYATDVLVFQQDEQPLGLLTYLQSENKVTVGLFAVDVSVRGKKVAQKLMSAFLSRFPLGTKIEVATQKHNLRACKFYEHQGFEISQISNIYHLWIK